MTEATDQSDDAEDTASDPQTTSVPKDAGGKEGAKQKSDSGKATYRIIGFDKQQTVHNMLLRAAKGMGLEYDKVEAAPMVRQTLANGSVMVVAIDYDQKTQNTAFDLCRIANRYHAAPVLMGHFFKMDVFMAMRAGVADIIKKPFGEKPLQQRMKRLLQKTGKTALMKAKSTVEKIDWGESATPDKKAQLLVKKAKELLALPHAVSEVIRLSNDPKSEMKDLAPPISTDPALAAIVLKRSNSVALGGRKHIDNLLDAVIRIGRKEVKNLAVAMSVFKMFDKNTKTFAFNRQMYWVHSLGTAIAAAELARADKTVEPEDAFLAGLLHDLGKIIYDDYMNSEYEGVVRRAASENLRINKLEQDTFLMDHALLGSLVSENWKLPEKIIRAVRQHHKVQSIFDAFKEDDDKDEIEARALVRIVCMANSVVKAMRLGHGGDFFVDDIPDAGWEAVFPKAPVISTVCTKIREQLREFAELLGINLRAAQMEVDVQHKEHMAAVAPEGLGTLVRFFFEAQGYNTKAVPAEKMIGTGGVRFLSCDLRPLPEEVQKKLLAAQPDEERRYILLVQQKPDERPAPGVVCFPGPHDFLQLEKLVTEFDA